MTPRDFPNDQFADAVMEGAGFRKIEGDVQIVMAMWVPGKGWLHTRRGITVCGPIASQLTGLDAIVLEVKSGYRALQYVLKQEEANAVGE